jgi:TolB protein
MGRTMPKVSIAILSILLPIGCATSPPTVSPSASIGPSPIDASPGPTPSSAVVGPSTIAALPTGPEPSIGPLDVTTLSGRIVFSAGTHPHDDIYSIEATGAGLTRLTDDATSDFDPTWAGDGRRIAWRTDRLGEDEIFVMNADGSDERNLTQSPAEDYAPAWSPDGTLIAFASDNNSLPAIWVVGPAGNGRRQVTREVGGEYASWSPDNRQLVFIVNTALESALTQAQAGWDLYVIGIDGSGTRRLTSWTGDEKGPDWSPTRDEIVFEAQATDRDIPDLWIVEANGSGLQRLTWRGGYAPAWSPDGKYVAFSTGNGLAIVSRDGTEMTPLPTPGLVEPVFADWIR